MHYGLCGNGELMSTPKRCVVSNFSFVPRQIEDNSYAKFWEVKNLHYGLCENVE